MQLQKMIKPGLISIQGLVLAASLSLAQAQPANNQPSVGQAGKDVIWLPTNQALVDKMLDLANVTASDFVIDLGSGDGRTVITAAKRGARAIGIEYDPKLVQLATDNAVKSGVADKVTFMKADIFQSDFSKATVITMFLLPQLNMRLRPTLLNMKPGTRVVSNTFDMEDWVSDERATLADCQSHCNALFWVVPAKVQGTWKMPNGDLVLEQQYQMLKGTLKVGDASGTINEGKMTGDQIAFSVNGTRYTGRVSGNNIEGSAKSPSGETKWQATRAN
jgi:SAM-dependent methyltransferase